MPSQISISEKLSNIKNSSLHSSLENRSPIAGEKRKFKSFSKKKTPTTLNNFFTFKRTLQNSIYGCVVEARFLQTNEKRAVKVFNKDAVQNRRSNVGNRRVLESFTNEVHLLRHFRDVSPHPHVLSLADKQEQKQTATQILVSMPMADSDLFTVMEDSALSGGADFRAMRMRFAEMVVATSHIHKQGWIHCDISLENVLLFGSSSPRKHRGAVICDFGLALPEGTPWSFERFRCGKARYTAPEIYNGALSRDGVANPSIDVFSLGICLFMMLFLVAPFEKPDARVDGRFQCLEMGLLWRMIQEWRLEKSLADAAAMGAVSSKSLLDLIQGMLHANPKKRWTLEQVESHPWLKGAIYSVRSCIDIAKETKQGIDFDNEYKKEEGETKEVVEDCRDSCKRNLFEEVVGEEEDCVRRKVSSLVVEELDEETKECDGEDEEESIKLNIEKVKSGKGQLMIGRQASPKSVWGI
eukprot:g4862.t1